ncbi:MAG: LLM class flavin-dependent oxidoreductase [Candidatus Dadabacteria bacterium]|nr:MAG: LLM class flavin-dependent oxidoreductase [Candidatus Dadabacteria bacterium]
MSESRTQRRYWTVIQPMPAPMLAMAVKQAEAAGVHGVFAPQVYGPPFVTLAAVAALSARLQLASGIAIAATRSPFETAMAAIDLDRISGGRFTLGLGTSVHAWTCGVYGAPRYKPVTHLRETIAAIRHIVRGAHKGNLEPFEGEYYRADFRELQPHEPPVREQIPIWVAALRRRLVELAAQTADGLIGHPMWSVRWALEEMKPVFDAALSAAGRRREDVEVSLWPWAAPNPNEAEAIDDARATMAFYGGVAQYEPFFEAHGFGEVARKLQEGVQRGDYRSVAHLVPDEMVRAFVAVGPPEKVRERVEPLWSFADSLCVIPPVYGLPPEKVMFYVQTIAETFYGQEALAS